MVTKTLVVEDHTETRDALTLWLEQRGYDVVVANDGYEGVLQAAANLPDLIIADLNMPTLDGVEMIRVLRARHEYSHVPILAITAHGMERAEQAIKAGAVRVLAKPLEPDILYVFVKELLNRKNPLHESATF
jgi:two-component system, cell cycle response regulator DivK